MTAVVAHRLPDRIEIISDGAVYDGLRIVRGFECKIDRFPKFNAVMTGRGPSRVLDLFRDKLGEMLMDKARTYDLALHAIANKLEMLKPLAKLDPIQIILAGMSEMDGPVIHTFGNTDEGGLKAFELHEMPYGSAYGYSTPAEMNDIILERGGLRAIAVEFMNAVRGDSGEAAMVVGGHIDFTVISEDGVTIETIHKWDDKIGERIHPFGPNVVPIAGMSRQQRRTMEREQRKMQGAS
jgi:hypothetical protein